MVSPEARTEWVQLTGQPPRLQSLIVGIPGAWLIGALVILHLARPVTFLWVVGPWRWLATIATAVVLFALIAAATVLYLRARYPSAFADLAGHRIRAGGKTADFSDLTTARLLVSASKTRRLLYLELSTGRRRGLRVLVVLRDRQGRPIDPAAAVHLGEVIGSSRIAMPDSPDDPSGRFAHYNFPDNVSKEEALELVADPPRFTDALPIPPRK